MNNFVMWFLLFASLIIYGKFEEYDKKCNDAGGSAFATVAQFVCLHPSAIIDLK